MLQRIIKDELLYGNAYIDPDKEKPLDPETVFISDEELDNWIILDGRPKRITYMGAEKVTFKRFNT